MTSHEERAAGSRSITVRMSSRSRSDRKSTRLNSSHSQISYAVFCLKKKKNFRNTTNNVLPSLSSINSQSETALHTRPIPFDTASVDYWQDHNRLHPSVNDLGL